MNYTVCSCHATYAFQSESTLYRVNSVNSGDNLHSVVWIHSEMRT